MSLPASALPTPDARPRASSDDYLTLVVARVGVRRFAIPALAVERVLRMAAFAVVPGLPSGVVGLLNLHGAVMPVIDARLLFDESPQPPRADQHLIVLGDGEPRALWVDAIDHVPNVPSRMVHALPGHATGDPVEAVVHLDRDVLPVLAVGALLPGGLARRGDTAR